jgi:hypothetical protein
MTSAYDYSELHELVDRLEPGQAEELRRHTLRLVNPTPSAASGYCGALTVRRPIWAPGRRTS